MSSTPLQFHFDEGDWSWPREMIERAWSMLHLIRKFEEKSIQIYKEGLLGGSLHSSIGQEAVATGVGLALERSDFITTTYRGRGHALAKGVPPFPLFAELLGRIEGCCKGKGGPMHIASKEEGLLGANGIVAGGMPIATGAALSAKLKKTGAVSIAFFGDGATNQGAFHESMNFAAVFALPVIFVCENNLYSEMTPIRDSVRNEHLAERAAAYCMPALIVDGNDMRAVYEATKLTVDRARKGGGPTFIEAKTYRLMGHMIGDGEPYRTRGEVEQAWKREPISLFRAKCREKGLTEERLDALESAVRLEIDKSYARALASAEPSNEEIFTDVC